MTARKPAPKKKPAKPQAPAKRARVTKALAEVAQPPKQQLDKTGRPTLFTPTLAERFCQLIGEGNSYRKACKAEGMPHVATVCRWLATHREGEEGQAYDAFREQLARALEARADLRGEKIEGYIERLANPKARHRLDPQAVRALVEAQRVLMEIEAPKKYGKALTIKGSKTEPLAVTRYDHSDDALAAIAAGGLKGST